MFSQFLSPSLAASPQYRECSVLTVWHFGDYLCYNRSDEMLDTIHSFLSCGLDFPLRHIFFYCFGKVEIFPHNYQFMSLFIGLFDTFVTVKNIYDWITCKS